MARLHSSDELVHVVGAEADGGVVAAAHVDLGEDILEADLFVGLVEIDHAAGDVEEGEHLGAVGRHREGMDLAGRLEDVGAGLGHPVVLEIAPAALDDVAVDRRRMEVAAQDAGTADAQQVAPLALHGIEQQRTKPDGLGLTRVQAVVGNLWDLRPADALGWIQAYAAWRAVELCHPPRLPLWPTTG